jgi:carbonic anhydrase
MRKAWKAYALLMFMAVIVSSMARAQWKTHWTYEGATGVDHWGDLDPAYAPCKLGKEQSPIDIQSAEKTDLPALRFEYKSEPLKYLINNGYTIRVNYHDAPGSGSSLVVNGKRYQLTQFHFHHPSEEYVYGKPYEMEAHFMHQAADGKIAGVVVFLKPGAANAAVQQLWDHMPKSESKEIEIAGVEVNPSALLPHELSYYEYTGSITAPPCTEGVEWFVLKTPIEISADQIKAFAELYPHDVRPLQPLNGRMVKESK